MDYENALALLHSYIPQDIGHQDRQDFELYKQRLLENITTQRRYGSTETLRHERSLIVERLTVLAMHYTTLSFTDLAFGKRPTTPLTGTPTPPDSPTTKWNIPIIRELLTRAFSDEHLTTFCYDHFPVVHEQFTLTSSKPQKIQWLIDHCNKFGTMAHMLELVKNENPYQYQLVESSLRYA